MLIVPAAANVNNILQPALFPIPIKAFKSQPGNSAVLCGKHLIQAGGLQKNKFFLPALMEGNQTVQAAEQ